MKALLVIDKWRRAFGTLSYDTQKDIFYFKYDDNTPGYAFSDIDINEGKEFEQNSMFNVFSYDDSFARSELVRNLDLYDKSENQLQWFLKERLAITKSMSCKGFYFEEIKEDGLMNI
ncbi:MAG: hypothetical protein WC141_01525 [Arcobacteraceae bacterium]